MPLIQCHECKGKVSDHARTCPHCGAPVIATIKRKEKAALVDLGIRIVGAIVVGLIVWFAFRQLTGQIMAPLKALEQKQQPSR